MKKLYKLILLSLLMPMLSWAQSNYKPGLVVMPKGDTVKGYIDYQEWDLNPDVINFRKTADGQVFKYGVSDITYFSVDKLNTYVKYTGTITTNQTDPNNVMQDVERDTSFRTGSVFLRVVEKGPIACLYAYKDDIKVRYFLGDAPNFTPKELIFRLTRTNTEYTYRKQLSAEAFNHNELNDALIDLISKTEYTEDNILDVVGKINHISKAEYNKSYANGPAFTLEAGVGMNITTLSPAKGYPFYSAGARTYNSIMPAALFGANFFVNPGTRKLQLAVQASLSEVQLRESYTSAVYPYVATIAQYNAIVGTGSLQVIYNFYNKDNFKVFAGAGIIAYVYSYSNHYIGAKDHNNSSVDLNATEPWMFNSFNNAFLLKAGVQVSKHFAITAEYQTDVDPNGVPYYSLTSTTKQVAIIYIFR